MAIPKEDVTLHTFTAEASVGLPGPVAPRRRAAGHDAVASCPLPSESEEVWRYTPINNLVLDDFAAPAQGGRPRRATSRRRGHHGAGPSGRERAGAQRIASAFNSPWGADTGVAFGRAEDVPGSSDMLGSVQQGGDALVRLNDAFAPDPSSSMCPRVRLDAPVLIVHWCDSSSAFPCTSVRVGEESTLSLVEVFAGAEGTDRSLVGAGDGAGRGGRRSLSYVSLQIFGGAGLVHRASGRTRRGQVDAAYVHRRPRCRL